MAIAVTKVGAFLVTGSSSLLAEAAHSLADSGNQLLLMLGGARSRRARTAEHPFGYGRERYIYAFVVALVLFVGGAVFAIREGIAKLGNPQPLHHPVVAIITLLLAGALEGWSFRTAVGAADGMRRGLSWVTFVRRAKEPELPVVLLEDGAALIGILLALAGVTCSLVTGDPTWDAVATICIGALLGIVAIILAIETKSMLVGESANSEVVARIRAALLEDPVLGGVRVLRTMHLGPDDLLVVAEVDVAADVTAGDLAHAIERATTRVQRAAPAARQVFIEPGVAGILRPRRSTLRR